ncbi:MAG: hypothetical protein QNI85_09045 [Desulfobacterales bacterium]|nr:hypothetical protein [Desulfobacterales bacterium]
MKITKKNLEMAVKEDINSPKYPMTTGSTGRTDSARFACYRPGADILGAETVVICRKMP